MNIMDITKTIHRNSELGIGGMSLGRVIVLQ